MSVRTILIMAGGTGGHVMPGLAVADEMRARRWNVVWMGNPDGMEATLVPSRGVPMCGVRFGGLRGKGFATRLALPFNLARALWQAVSALRRVRPSVVLGMGGYIAFPGGLGAALLRIPLVLHEQNSIAGLTNRVLAKLASRVLVAFPGALPGGEWRGNPVRTEIADLAPPETRFAGRAGPLRVLVLGGSLGARALNEVVPRALALIAPERRPHVTHQSGRAHVDALRDAYREAGVEARAVDFIDDMASAYADADVVVCRSGAMTVAELAAAGAASVLVPFPFAVDDHQTANARFLSERGAAELMPQDQLTPEGLARWLDETCRERLLEMARAARAAAKPDATARVADDCEAVARR